ncbi:MAG TPA: SCO family protein [Tepidisphaeraceae bacterium]|nr:SCO family protein [Tepidisphaeraceae bacterium]
MSRRGVPSSVALAMLLGLLQLLQCAPARAGITMAALPKTAFIEQHTGAVIPPELIFTDESGNDVQLGQMLAAKPTLLVLAYFSCPDLCPMTLRHLTQGLNGIALRAGDEFQVVVISFDSRDTPAAAAQQRLNYTRGYRHGDDADGWHFLTGRQPMIDRLTAAVGYHCALDADVNRFAHAAGVMVVSPGGRLSHYFFGVDYSPADLEAAVRDAAAGRATVVDQPDQQYCYAYNPATGRRGRQIVAALRCSGVCWMLALFGYIGTKLTQEFRSRRSTPVSLPPGEGRREGVLR